MARRSRFVEIRFEGGDKSEVKKEAVPRSTSPNLPMHWIPRLWLVSEIPDSAVTGLQGTNTR